MTQSLRQAAELKMRCAEVLEWQSTGLLRDGALREFAKSAPLREEHMTLQWAESETAREAIRLVVSLSQALEEGAQQGGDERALFEAWMRKEHPSHPLDARAVSGGLGGSYNGTLVEYLNSGAQHKWFAWQARAAIATASPQPDPQRKLWLWKNFVDGKPEYWAFDHPFLVNMQDDDPQTLGEPCGYAIFKPCRPGRSEWTEESVPRDIARAKAASPQPDLHAAISDAVSVLRHIGPQLNAEWSHRCERAATELVSHAAAEAVAGADRTPEAVAEVIASEHTGKTLREIDGRWKFLPIGTVLYDLGAGADRTAAVTPEHRELLGLTVRRVWMEWAKEQPSPKPSWLVPWTGLSEPEREVDRRIGEAIWNMREGMTLAGAERTAAEDKRDAEPCCGQTMAEGYRCAGCPHALPTDRLIPRRTSGAAVEPVGSGWSPGSRRPEGDWNGDFEPGGCECIECGCIFIGSEARDTCKVCADTARASQESRTNTAGGSHD